MTDYLRLWKADADALGIPENIQRGLAFTAGIELQINGAPVPRESLPLLATRLCSYFPDLPADIGGDFRPDPIAALLFELALQFNPDFTPRKITLPDGASFDSMKKEVGSRLPNIHPFNLSNASVVAKSLYSQIGDCINETDLEHSVIAGFLFFQSYYGIDSQNTAEMCRYATKIRPPHMQWISRCILFELADLPTISPFSKTLNAFFRELHQQHSWTQSFFSLIEPQLPPLVELDLATFRMMSLTAARNFAKLVPKDANLQRGVAEFRADNPPALFQEDFEEALKDLDANIKRQWGYADIADDLSSLYPGERFDRLCCILTSTVRDALLRTNP